MNRVIVIVRSLPMRVRNDAGFVSNAVVRSGSQPTYEGLKLSRIREKPIPLPRSQPTYEGLKRRTAPRVFRGPCLFAAYL